MPRDTARNKKQLPRTAVAGRRIPVKIRKTVETWNEYTLEDGTVLRAKLVLIEVNRIKGKYNPQGDPIYEVRGGQVLDAKVPKKLKRK